MSDTDNNAPPFSDAELQAVYAKRNEGASPYTVNRLLATIAARDAGLEAYRLALMEAEGERDARDRIIKDMKAGRDREIMDRQREITARDEEIARLRYSALRENERAEAAEAEVERVRESYSEVYAACGKAAARVAQLEAALREVAHARDLVEGGEWDYADALRHVLGIARAALDKDKP